MHSFIVLESIYDRMDSLPSLHKAGLPVLRREVHNMTAYEILSLVIEILVLLMSFGSLIVMFLTFFDKRNKKK